MIDAKKHCPGCNSHDLEGRLMHRIDQMSTGMMRGYWCERCNYWEDIEKPIKGIKHEPNL